MENTPPVMKRQRGGPRKACNECKQQKLRCDIVRTPADACSRCKGLQIECKVEPSFTRISKRRRNAEMEREIIGLRRQLASNTNQGDHAVQKNIDDEVSQSAGSTIWDPASTTLNQGKTLSTNLEPQTSSTPVTIQSEGSGLFREDGVWRLEDVFLSKPRATALFEQFFTYYHPFIPLLDPRTPPDYYLGRCPLLAWTIICVASRRAPAEPGLLGALTGPFNRLLWSTITSVPQDYAIVKALCLLCTWPIPTTSQRKDATFMLCGLMMQISMQLGLHRPVQAEEFTTFRIGHSEAVKDRLQTWVVCNIVAQNIATGYGQPPGTIYDWVFEPSSLQDAGYYPSEDLRTRLYIEKFCDRITKSLYNSKPDPTEFIKPERLLIVQLLENELRDMEASFGRNISHINTIHLRAAELHLRYFIFLGSNPRTNDFTKLFAAITSFLSQVLDLETSPGQLISYATNYMLQMIISAAFGLMKLLKSTFRHHIDFEYGKLLFNGAITSLRRISIMDHDRPVRLADVLAQMWNAGDPEPPSEEDNLQLKVRCRMSMSHVYDTVWRWRHRFRPRKGTSDTQLVTANPAESTTMVPEQIGGSLENPTMIYPPNLGEGGAFLSEAGFSEIFDSLNWVFDEFPDPFIIPPTI
ncbi:hypothetical protein BDV26DRAFT_264046 [Aspergillus bertholletiae]|uniref:Zn(2)-C6 fungal-type domain-containing protein n=1 Tax=Aspergillus bertholletiae TaxID=1226010 RepID=A0A5N7B5J2_9EURO|nr:hypothetical protein BDV26DRAFT_264046 [Aspergillus bertholletiae]